MYNNVCVCMGECACKRAWARASVRARERACSMMKHHQLPESMTMATHAHMRARVRAHTSTNRIDAPLSTGVVENLRILPTSQIDFVDKINSV